MTNDLPLTSNRRKVVFVIAVTVLFCLPVLTIAQYIAHLRHDERDTWLYAYYGQQITRGFVLYEQLWDNKPPGMYWVNAAGSWLSGGSITGTIALCAAASAGACGVAFAAARRLYGWSTAGAVTAMAAVYLFLYPYHVGGNRPATFFALTELAAFLFYCRSFHPSRPAWVSLLPAGLCAGLSVWFKQTGMAVAAGIVLHHVFCAARASMPAGTIIRRLLTFAAGWALAVGAAAGLLAITSDLGWAWHAVVAYNHRIVATGAAPGGWLRWFGQRQHEAMLALPAILAAATVLHPIVRWLWPDRRSPVVDDEGSRPPGLLFVLWAWLVAAVVLALAGPYQRSAYWGIALPPLVMLSGHGVFLVLRSGRAAGMERPAIHVVVFVLWAGVMLLVPLVAQVREFARQRWLANSDAGHAQFAATVQAVRDHSRPGDALFVWEYNPKLYWASERSPAIRYFGATVAEQLGAAGQALMDETCALIEEAAPKVIVADPNRVPLTPGRRGNGGLSLRDFPRWLRAHYHHPESDRLSHVWVRND
ncbi:MAG: hypothetical protein JSV19_07110 [Phycisphaerales bacterium]|nr:MAG: hypothetical protein JSV19_07110 [Phycisphaerales bacterium]